MSTHSVPAADGRGFGFDPATTALIIIDMQRDFIDDEGACAAVGADVKPLQAIVPRVAALLQAARGAGLTVVHTRYGFKADCSDLFEAVRRQSRDAGGEYGTPGPLGRILIRGEPGFEIVEPLTPQPDEIIIDKPTFGAFAASTLDTILRSRGVTPLLVSGVTTQCCVECTIREAVDRGYYVCTVEDCCGAFEADLHANTIKAIQSEGHLFGWVARAADIRESLSG